MSKLQQETAKVIGIVSAGLDLFRLTLASPAIAASACPGQIVSLRVQDGPVPLLRRPFAVFDADPAAGTLDILFEVVGRGTEILSRKSPGDGINAVGPSGTGFPLPDSGELPLAVAGGIGLAPVHFLCSRLAKQGLSPRLFYGAPMAAKLADAAFDGRIAVHLATDDGSRGRKGFAIDPLRAQAEDLGKKCILYACGPQPMLRACAQLATERGWKCYLSMEQRMACGVGACGGCVVDIRISGSVRRLRVCKEGPVFDAEQIVWT